MYCHTEKIYLPTNRSCISKVGKRLNHSPKKSLQNLSCEGGGS